MSATALTVQLGVSIAEFGRALRRAAAAYNELNAALALVPVPVAEGPFSSDVQYVIRVARRFAR
jgi:hypothetical protein